MLSWEDRRLGFGSFLEGKIFFEFLTKDIVMEYMQLFRGAETSFSEWVDELFSCSHLFSFILLGKYSSFSFRTGWCLRREFCECKTLLRKRRRKFKPACTTRLREPSIPADGLLSRKVVVLSSVFKWKCHSCSSLSLGQWYQPFPG